VKKKNLCHEGHEETWRWGCIISRCKMRIRTWTCRILFIGLGIGLIGGAFYGFLIEPNLLEIRLPAKAAEDSLNYHLKLETGEELRGEWRGAGQTIFGAAEVEGTRYVVKRLPLPSGLSWGYHRLVLEFTGRPAESLVISAPPMSTLPLSGVSIPLIILSSVDFPEPLLPKRIIISPSLTLRFKLLRTICSATITTYEWQIDRYFTFLTYCHSQILNKILLKGYLR